MIEKELVLPDSDAEHAPPLADVKKKPLSSMRSFRVPDCRDGKTGERKASLYLST
jgi:hypothetical protein